MALYLHENSHDMSFQQNTISGIQWLVNLPFRYLRLSISDTLDYFRGLRLPLEAAGLIFEYALYASDALLRVVAAAHLLIELDFSHGTHSAFSFTSIYDSRDIARQHITPVIARLLRSKLRGRLFIYELTSCRKAGYPDFR